MRKVVGILVGLALALGPAGTASAQGANQRFVLVFNGSDAGRVVGVGPVSGVGTVVDEGEGSESSFPVAFVFRHGSLSLNVTTVDESFDFDPVSCVVHVSIAEEWAITGGTGAFEGATGSGVFMGRGVLVLQRDADGACLGPESGVPPAVAVSVLKGTGSVTFGQEAAA